VARCRTVSGYEVFNKAALKYNMRCLARHVGDIDAHDPCQRHGDGHRVVRIGVHEVVGEEEARITDAHFYGTGAYR
jgi:hypothetical protein